MSTQSQPIQNDAKPGIRILVADPSTMYREALLSLLGREEGLTVIGVAARGKEVIDQARALRPDILLLDLLVTDPSAMEILRRLERESLPVRTIIFTNRSQKDQILESLKLGARGVIHRHVTLDLLFKCIRAVAAGEYWVGHENMCDLVNCVRAGEAPASKSKADLVPRLTSRELDIVNAVVEGQTNKDIAQKLSISEQTVKHHLTRIFEKTGVANRLELALLAMQGELH